MTRTINMKLIVACLLTTTLNACSLNSTDLNHARSENNDIEVYSTTAGMRGILLRKKSSETVYCAEPQPDASVSESLSENISASQASTANESEGASESESEKSLGGRSVNVLITREIFYRTCEFLANTQLGDEAKLKVFRASLQTIIDINTTDLGSGTNNQSSEQTSIAQSDDLEGK